MDKKMKIIALIALLVYVISPVDLAPGPVDDMIMCLMYAIMNYKTISNEDPFSYSIQEILAIPASVTIVRTRISVSSVLSFSDLCASNATMIKDSGGMLVIKRS